MLFSIPLLPGKLIRRYQRFLADIELKNGDKITAHCVNSGAMLGLTQPETPLWVSKIPESQVKTLKYRWEIAEVEGTYVGANTLRPNGLVEEALQKNSIPELQGYERIRREVKYGQNSRIDFLLEHADRSPCYLEIKNVHLKRGPQAQFPDSVTARGTKHLKELSLLASQGIRAVVLYIVQRNDCESFTLAKDIDPTYTAAAQQAKDKGVEFLCYACRVTPTEIQIERPLRIL